MTACRNSCSSGDDSGPLPRGAIREEPPSRRFAFGLSSLSTSERGVGDVGLDPLFASESAKSTLDIG
jgi:hypothetical protein